MTCSLPSDIPWHIFLAARNMLASGSEGLVFVQREHDWSCNPAHNADLDNADLDRANAILVASDDTAVIDRVSSAPCSVSRYLTDALGAPSIKVLRGSSLEPGITGAACIYLPVLFGAAIAKRSGRSFVVGHITQSLDGRIACLNGQSQWLGNDADQHHSHRMRALMEGIMVGATTALQDDPQLTVRHVEGEDPHRIVISGRGRMVEHGQGLKLMGPPGCQIFVDESLQLNLDNPNGQVTGVPAIDGKVDPNIVLEQLRQDGIHSVYHEGGSGSVSSFLQSGCIDLLQIHIASMIIGSGVPSLQLPVIEHLRDAMQLQMHHSWLDGHVLLTCRPPSKTDT